MTNNDLQELKKIIKESENRTMERIDKITNNLFIEISRVILDPIFRNYASLLRLYDNKSVERLAKRKTEIKEWADKKTENAIQSALDKYNLLLKDIIVEETVSVEEPQLNEKITEEEKPDIDNQKLESNEIDDMIDSINENSQLSKEPDNSDDDSDTDDDSQILIKKTVSEDDEDSMFEMFNADKINADPEFPEGYDPLNDPDNENGDPL